MQNYINEELKKSIESFQVKQGTSKEGNIYYYLSLVLNNGYEKKLFIQSAEEFAFCNAFQLLQSSHQEIDFND